MTDASTPEPAAETTGAPTSGAGSAPGRRDRNRERLYRAALELITERGYDATTMDDIAARAGMARRSAFNHFPAKSDITVEWTARRRQLSAPALGEGSHEDTGTDPGDRIRAWFRALALHTESTPTESEQMVRGWLGAQGPVEHPTGTPEALRPWLEAASRTGAIGDVEPSLAANMLFDVYLGALYRWFRTARPAPGSLVAEIDTLVAVTLRGLQNAVDR